MFVCGEAELLRWPPFVWTDFLEVESCQYGLRCRGQRGQVDEVHPIRRVAVQRPVRSFLVVERQVPFQALGDRVDTIVGPQNTSSYFTLLHSRSTNTLSR